MKYLYRNVKTGEVVETSTKVSGANWEPVEQEEHDPVDQEPEKPKSRRKKE